MKKLMKAQLKSKLPGDEFSFYICLFPKTYVVTFVTAHNLASCCKSPQLISQYTVNKPPISHSSCHTKEAAIVLVADFQI